MAKTDYKSIEEYHQAFTGETLERMKTIRKIIHEVAPEAEESISYQIPCFKYKGYLVYYAGFDKHVSVSHPFSQAFWEHFKEDLVGYKTSKAVIQLPHSKPLPVDLIRRIVAYRKMENEGK